MARITSEDTVCGRAAAIQVILNDLARLITGRKRTEHLPVPELLREADIPSLNHIVARDALAMMWGGLIAGNGPLVSVLNDLRPAGLTRAATSGKLNIPATSNPIIISGTKLWNRFHVDLCNIKTKDSLKSFITKEVWKNIPI